MKLSEVNNMSRKTDNLNRIIQDLEARYGKDDSDVQQLYVELKAVNAEEDARRKAWQKPILRVTHLRFSDVDNRALNT
jgi:hypothetical protein